MEASDLNYTVLRPGYLKEGEENDFVLSVKGEPAKGYITTIPVPCETGSTAYFGRSPVCEGKRQYHTGRDAGE